MNYLYLILLCFFCTVYIGDTETAQMDDTYPNPFTRELQLQEPEMKGIFNNMDKIRLHLN